MTDQSKNGNGEGTGLPPAQTETDAELEARAQELWDILTGHFPDEDEESFEDLIVELMKFFDEYETRGFERGRAFERGDTTATESKEPDEE